MKNKQVMNRQTSSKELHLISLRLGKMYTGAVLWSRCTAVLHHSLCAERAGLFLYE